MTEEKHQAAADQAPSAQSAFGGWMGGSLQPLLAGALTPIRTASPAARSRSRWATASAIHGAGWRCPRARDGENSASLIFLALPRSACPRFWAGFSTLSPPYGWG